MAKLYPITLHAYIRSVCTSCKQVMDREYERCTQCGGLTYRSFDLDAFKKDIGCITQGVDSISLLINTGGDIERNFEGFPVLFQYLRHATYRYLLQDFLHIVLPALESELSGYMRKLPHVEPVFIETLEFLEETIQSMKGIYQDHLAQPVENPLRALILGYSKEYERVALLNTKKYAEKDLLHEYAHLQSLSRAIFELRDTLNSEEFRTHVKTFKSQLLRFRPTLEDYRKRHEFMLLTEIRSSMVTFPCPVMSEHLKISVKKFKHKSRKGWGNCKEKSKQALKNFRRNIGISLGAFKKDIADFFTGKGGITHEKK